MLEISGPTTRLSTALAADCCWNYVAWPAPIEKPCQWMIELGELVTLRLLVPSPWICTLPFMTCGPVGLAHAGTALKQPPTASTIGRINHFCVLTAPSQDCLSLAYSLPNE